MYKIEQRNLANQKAKRALQIANSEITLIREEAENEISLLKEELKDTQNQLAEKTKELTDGKELMLQLLRNESNTEFSD